MENYMTEQTALQTFSNEEFGSIRTILIDDEPWFVGKDVASALGYKAPADALKVHVEADDKLTRCFTDSGQRRQMYVINESGMYSLIISSKLPSAKKFKHWVTSEVLPSIRKHGAYMTPATLEKALLSPDFLIQLAEKLKEEQEKNIRLAAKNAALIKETNEWDDRWIIHALLRKYAFQKCGGNYSAAYNVFYRRMNYKLHINLKLRLAKSKDNRKTSMDMIADREWKSALQIAVARCEEAGIDTADILLHCE